MKKFLLYFILIFILLLGSGYYYYHSLVKDITQKQKNIFETTQSEIMLIAEESVKLKNLFLFEKVIQNIQRKTPLKTTSLYITKHLIDDALLLNNSPFIDKSWKIIEVSIDAMQGYITPVGNGQYEVILNNESKIDKITLKYQAIKDSVIKDSLFEYDRKKLISIDTHNDNSIVSTTFKNKEYTLTFDFDMNFSKEELNIKLQNFLYTIFIITTCLLFIGVIIYNYFIKAKFLNAIASLEIYIRNILEGKMIKDSSLPKLVVEEFQNLHGDVIELTKKYVNTANELSISKDIIFQKDRTDELTGLPNKKSFEDAIKYMFVTNKKGFIIQLKIDKIGVFTQNHGPEIVDALIENFAHIVKNFFINNKNCDGDIYRFFGGEFAMIIYNKSSQEIESILNTIIELTGKLNDKYYFFENNIYYGATSFDQYGSIESIVQSAHDAYDNALKEKLKHYFIADEKSQNELNTKLESTVKDIISRNDFVLQYLHDTYTFGESPKLLMQEVSPLIIDSFTFESIPSGKFISVAEKMGFMSDFDKAIIEKTLEQIEFGELTHKICIVLSVSSLSNQIFLAWLKELLDSNAFAKQLIFVAPGYSVISNYDIFLNFIKILKSRNLEFMIKRYNPADLSLEKLKGLLPTYIRLEKVLCQDFKKDSSKQHMVKQILLFSEENDINILGDSVKNEQDYLAFEMLGFYGTSR
jgi:EAL domain-containing protein (putative c-di-GMP-specific phosphodiesterase class I)/GGDEF domain-containing protein